MSGYNWQNMVRRRDLVIADQEVLIGVMARALDIGDRLIERGYGMDTPEEWNETFSGVAEARRTLSKAKEGQHHG